METLLGNVPRWFIPITVFQAYKSFNIWLLRWTAMQPRSSSPSNWLWELWIAEETIWIPKPSRKNISSFYDAESAKSKLGGLRVEAFTSSKIHESADWLMRIDRMIEVKLYKATLHAWKQDRSAMDPTLTALTDKKNWFYGELLSFCCKRKKIYKNYNIDIWNIVRNRLVRRLV